MAEIHFFFKSKLSQWSKSPFCVNGINYGCAEQWMMGQKVLFFGDTEAHSEIMKATHPHDQKAWGRKVRGFDRDKWQAEAREILYIGNLAKFQQNPEHWKVLDDTGDKLLAESNPDDSIWGIGLPSDHPDAKLPEKWRGMNWLGEVLMRVRTQIRKERAQ